MGATDRRLIFRVRAYLDLSIRPNGTSTKNWTPETRESRLHFEWIALGFTAESFWAVPRLGIAGTGKQVTVAPARLMPARLSPNRCLAGSPAPDPGSEPHVRMLMNRIQGGVPRSLICQGSNTSPCAILLPIDAAGLIGVRRRLHVHFANPSLNAFPNCSGAPSAASYRGSAAL